MRLPLHMPILKLISDDLIHEDHFEHNGEGGIIDLQKSTRAQGKLSFDGAAFYGFFPRCGKTAFETLAFYLNSNKVQ